MSNTIHLTISRDYVVKWGVWESARELIQNALDTKKYKITYTDSEVTITTHAGALDRRNLLLGVSSKRDDDSSIGTYGEGFKLAMLVMLREGKSITIKNGKDLWTPHFSHHPDLHHECLALSIFEGAVEGDADTVTFTVGNLSKAEIAEIQSKTLHNFDTDLIEAQSNGSFCWSTPRNEPSKLYVGSLYVCDLGNKYMLSYNFAPNILHLDRDRQSVSDFHLALEATRMMAMDEKYELLAELAENGAEDVSDYFTVETTYGSRSSRSEELSPDIRDVVSENFVKNNGLNAYPINANMNEAQKRVQTVKALDAGLVPVVVKQGYYNLLKKDITEKNVSDFKSFNLTQEILKFYDENKSQLRGKPRRALEKIIETIELYEGKRELPVEIKAKVVVDKPVAPILVSSPPMPAIEIDPFDDIPF
jgi:hypothetical protein